MWVDKIGMQSSLFSLVLLSLLTCSRGFQSSEPGTPEQKPDYVFIAEPSIIEPGESATLVWRIPDATDVSIDAAGYRERELHRLGTFGGSGKLEVKPLEDTTYVISCEGSKTLVCASVSVRVRIRAPEKGASGPG